jgi:hypothetical protein
MLHKFKITSYLDHNKAAYLFAPAFNSSVVAAGNYIKGYCPKKTAGKLMSPEGKYVIAIKFAHKLFL